MPEDVRGYLDGVMDALAAAGYAPEGDAGDAAALLAGFDGWLRAARDAQAAQLCGAQDMARRWQAVEAGVPVARADGYARLAGLYLDEAGGDFGAAVRAAVAAFPLEGVRDGEGGQAAPLPRVVASAPGAGIAQRGWKEMPLGERAEVFRRDPERARQLAEVAGERL